ncbi:MAG: RnfABCDGE type electron transport complex subunit C [Erysipelotrichaceae bacterium]|nr:RnfABCDGE type electron transport complex subunit C [Erysipelotrichaceae bacterium]
MIAKTKVIHGSKQVEKIVKTTNSLPTIRYVDPDFVYLAITNARCPEGESYVKPGDKVKVGQVVGLRKGPFFEQPIHATVSGEVVGTVKKFHRSGKLTEFIQVKNDKKDSFYKTLKERTPEQIAKLTREDFVQITKDMALVGLGGSSFPTYIKFQTKDPIDTILINAVECEPFLSADHRLILEFPFRILRGITYAQQAFGAKRAVICIKKKYKDLYDTLTAAIARHPEFNIEVKKVGNYYPQGWEIELIKSGLGVSVPTGVLPAKLGIMVFNVSTIVGLYKAVRYNMPVVKRNFTITGTGVNVPQNFRVRVGTSIKELIDYSKGYKGDENKVLILGGPMMGANLVRDDAVITKTCTSCIILNENKETEEPCVRCASCVYSCPAGLQPVAIMQAVKNNDKEALKGKLNIRACILCGMCSYTCTSKIHLTDYCRKAKKMAM